MDILGSHEIPIGFGMELAKNSEAMNAFSAMNDNARHHVIEEARSMQSKQEMEQYVSSLSTSYYQAK